MSFYILFSIIYTFFLAVVYNLDIFILGSSLCIQQSPRFQKSKSLFLDIIDKRRCWVDLKKKDEGLNVPPTIHKPYCKTQNRLDIHIVGQWKSQGNTFLLLDVATAVVHRNTRGVCLSPVTQSPSSLSSSVILFCFTAAHSPLFGVASRTWSAHTFNPDRKIKTSRFPTVSGQ